MAISRDTFDPAKAYRRIRFHQDRDLLDSELNEVQALWAELLTKLFGGVFVSGSILEDEKTVQANAAANIVTVPPCTVFVSWEDVATNYLTVGVEQIAGGDITFDPDKTSGVDVVYLEVLREVVGRNEDAALVNPYTGEPAAERERWVTSLHAEDTSGEPLPAGVIGRLVAPLFLFDRATGEVSRAVPRRTPLVLDDLGGTIEGNRITLASLTEDQIAFTASEGLPSLLQNLADRMEDQSGSFVVEGLQSRLGTASQDAVEVVTEVGRAYVRGFRMEMKLPHSTPVPIARVTRTVLGEWKSLNPFPENAPPTIDILHYLNHRPVSRVLSVRALAESTRTLTKGAPGGSDDLPDLGTFSDVLSVTQGGTTYVKGVDYANGLNNTIDWLGGNEPLSGSSYDVTWEYTRELPTVAKTTLVTAIDTDDTQLQVAEAIFQDGDPIMIGNEEMQVLSGGGTTTITVERGRGQAGALPHSAGDPLVRFTLGYLLGGPYGQIMPYPDGTWHFCVTAVNGSDGETAFNPANVVSIDVKEGDVLRLDWPPVSGAASYHIYASNTGTDRTDFTLIGQTSGTHHLELFVRYGESPDNPPVSNGAPGMTSPKPTVQVLDRNFILFPPVEDHANDYVLNPGALIAVDYEYPLARRDLIYATASDIRHLAGEPSDRPETPVAPAGTLPLAEVFCPPDSPSMEVRNLALTRVTMTQIHRMLRDIEDLKYNDALSQLNADLAARDATPKKGIYTDDFSSEVQSDPNHPDWDARMDTTQRFVAPPRTASGVTLVHDEANSSAVFGGFLAGLAQSETPILSQPQYSGEQTLNPPMPDFVECVIQQLPGIVRPGEELLVSVSGLTPDDNAVTVVVGDTVVASGLTADTFGRLETTLTLPAHVPLGERPLLVQGSDRSATSRIGIAGEVALSRVQAVQMQWPVNEPEAEPPPLEIVRFDPSLRVQARTPVVSVASLAQTFSLSTPASLKSLGLHFAAKDNAAPVTVKLVEVSNGRPQGDALAVATLIPLDISTSGETKVTFPDAVALQAGTVYAVVLSTGAPGYRVRVATVGETGPNGRITRQAYDRGHLLIGRNGDWQAELATDLTMTLYGLTFQTTGTVEFDQLTGLSLAAFALDTWAWTPPGTNLVWEYRPDAATSWRPVTPEAEEALMTPAASLQFRARMTSGATNLSPLLAHRAVRLVGYETNPTGTYLTRMMELAQGVASTKVYAQMNIPSGCAVTWYASNDDGTTWVALTEEPGTRRIVNSVWTEYTLAGTFADATKRQVRYKAVMTSAGARYPKIHRLGATLS